MCNHDFFLYCFIYINENTFFNKQKNKLHINAFTARPEYSEPALLKELFKDLIGKSSDDNRNDLGSDQ